MLIYTPEFEKFCSYIPTYVRSTLSLRRNYRVVGACRNLIEVKLFHVIFAPQIGMLGYCSFCNDEHVCMCIKCLSHQVFGKTWWKCSFDHPWDLVSPKSDVWRQIWKQILMKRYKSYENICKCNGDSVDFMTPKKRLATMYFVIGFTFVRMLESVWQSCQYTYATLSHDRGLSIL